VVDGPKETTNCPPLLLTESVQGVQESGERTPEEALTE